MTLENSYSMNNLENVKSSKFDQLSSRSFRKKKFVHSINVTLSVKTARLCERAINYINKHLGKQHWTFDNGTEVRLAKFCEKEPDYARRWT